MQPSPSSELPRSPATGNLERASRLACLGGAAASLALTLYGGRHNRSVILVLLFAGWVLSPLVAALWAGQAFRNWRVAPQAGLVLHAAILLVALAPLPIYAAAAFGYLAAKLGLVFLALPAACWALLAVALVTALVSRRKAE